jgi:Skp family chaperone for outer membrane proteins
MRIILLIFFIVFPNFSFSNETINFIDLNFILNKSTVGNKIIIQLNNANKELLDTFKKKENLLNEKEKKLIAQKNILEKSELNKKILFLQDEINEYNKKKNTQIKNLGKKKIDAQSRLLKIINTVLVDYAKENNIAMIMKKESIILGHSSKDITSEILKIINNEKIKIEIK